MGSGPGRPAGELLAQALPRCSRGELLANRDEVSLALVLTSSELRRSASVPDTAPGGGFARKLCEFQGAEHVANVRGAASKPSYFPP